MKVYHGSYTAINEIDLNRCEVGKDFGRGFYVTSLYEQAEFWAIRKQTSRYTLLGMTCDPICGLVQIPCIERNAYAAARALDANLYSSFTDGTHLVSFDRVVEVMKQTGHDLPSLYKETAEGGLVKGHFIVENDPVC